MENNDLVNLFKIPGVIVKIPTIWFFKNCMKDNYYNAHLIIRYKTVQAQIENNNASYWWGIYNNMQQKRVSQKPIIPREKANNQSNFENLILSFLEKGFDYSYPIIINKYFRLVDGSHRLSIALYLRIPYVPVFINSETLNHDPEYSLNWFLENGFEDLEEIIKNTYGKILEDWGN